MGFLREMFGYGSRPYPLDRKRRQKVLVALAEKEMTISGLARSLNLPQSQISFVINGRRLSTKTEQRIADFLGKSADDLFPTRTPAEIKKMREAEAKQRGKSA
ncbi:MAG: helix-turn-helix domain-containing protein [Treponema sp.]|jgi:plasmid maintenance system antidote protein VapI|nr:helix-turn-helix domain-containing protein [Treponema sp.]